MLFHLQFPFSDLRRFIPTFTSRIPVPSWPAPIVDEEFVRSFGAVRLRPRGGLTGWIAEAEYCEIKRALLFPPSALNQIENAAPHSAAKVPLRAAFRRLYFDGYAVGKIEVGLSTLGLPAVHLPISDLVVRILTVPAIVRTVSGGSEPRPLYRAGKPLVQLYNLATTKVLHNLGQDNQKSALFGEAPMLFIEMTAAETERVNIPPPYAHKIPLNSNHNFNLFFWRNVINAPNSDGIATQPVTVSIWCAIINRLPLDPDARRLRIYLLRLNAEHQALKRVLKVIDTQQIAPTSRDVSAQLLQDYLNTSTRRIGVCESRAQAFSSDLDTLAFSVFDIMAPGQRDSLKDRLRLIEVRMNIGRKVEAYASKQTIHIEMYGGVLDMGSGDTINVTNATNVNIKSTLTNVRQMVGAMPAGDDTQKQELQDLLRQLEELLQQVPPAKAEEAEAVATQASQLVQASTNEKPNRTTLQLIGNGLKQAADFVKDAVPSAVTIAGQIVSLIGKMHGLPL